MAIPSGYTAKLDDALVESGSVTGQTVMVVEGPSGASSTGAAILARTTGTEQPAATDDALVVYDVGGGAATASSEYRATTNGGYDGTVVYASASTLTVTGTPFTIQNEDIVYIREVDATGNTAALFVNGAGGVHMEISSGTVTKSGGADFSANGVYELGFNGQDKGYLPAFNANQVSAVNPAWSRSAYETVVDVTNETDGTNNYYLDMDGFKRLDMQLIIGAGSGSMTVTVEGTIQDDGTAASSCTYVDVTNAAYGAASFTASNVLNDAAEYMGGFKYVKIKSVSSTGGANDADLTVYAKRCY